MFEFNLIQVLKQQFIECKSVKHINENSETSQYKKPSKLFFNSMINIKNFDQNLLNIDQISFKKDY